jgi:hypothetical protein
MKNFKTELKRSLNSIFCSFDGKHEGIGPFKNAGGFYGELNGNTRELNLSNVRIESGDGHVALREGSVVYLNKDGSGKVRFLAESRNLKAGVLTLFGSMEGTGSWDRALNEAPNDKGFMEIDVFARSLWVNQTYLDGNLTHLSVRKGVTKFSPIKGSNQQISGQLKYQNYPDMFMDNFRFVDNRVEKVYLHGSIGPQKWDYKLNLNEVDASIIQGLFDTTYPISGSLTAQAHGQGSLLEPKITSILQWEDGHFGILPVDSVNANLIYDKGRVDIFDIDAEKKRGYLIKGKIRFDTSLVPDEKMKPPLIELNLEKGDLSLLSELFPEVSKSKGTFEGNVLLQSQDNRSVTLSGQFLGDKWLIRSAHIPNLEKGMIDLKIENNKLIIRRAEAQMGEGKIQIGGSIEFQKGRPSEFNMSLKTIDKGVLVRIPELAIAPGPVFNKLGVLKKRLAGASRAEPEFDLNLSGSVDSPNLTGNIILNNTVFTYPPSPVENEKRNTSSVKKWLKNIFKNMNWDVGISAGKRTWFQNEFVDAAVNGSLQFTGVTSNLLLNGRISATQGSIVYSGNEFTLKEADLDIETTDTTPYSLEGKQILVYLKAKAEREVYYVDGLSNNNEDVIIMVVDRSLIGEIQPRFYSKNNPTLDSQKALRLALGLPLNSPIEINTLLPDQRERESSRADTDKLLRLGLVQLIDSSLASPLARAIARNTGLVDFIRVTYQENDPDADEDLSASADKTDITQNQFLKYAKGTKVKFGRGLSDRLFADYSFRVDQYQEKIDLRHEVELAYRMHKNLFIRGITELDSERTLGRPPDRRAILENQWRFGLPRKKPEPLKTTENYDDSAPPTSAP